MPNGKGGLTQFASAAKSGRAAVEIATHQWRKSGAEYTVHRSEPGRLLGAKQCRTDSHRQQKKFVVVLYHRWDCRE